MLNLYFLVPKRHIPARNRVVWRIMRANRFGNLGCRASEPSPSKKPSKHFDAQFHAYREKKPHEGSWLNFACAYTGVRDFTWSTFGDDRLRGLNVAGVEFPFSPLTCIVVLTTFSHYRASVRYVSNSRDGATRCSCCPWKAIAEWYPRRAWQRWSGISGCWLGASGCCWLAMGDGWQAWLLVMYLILDMDCFGAHVCGYDQWLSGF